MMLALFIACDDAPSDVGLEGFDRDGATGEIKKDTLYVDDITNYTSFMDSVVTSGTNRLYLGSVDQYDFRILMRFFFANVDDSIRVTSAALEFVSSASYGSGGSFQANVHSITRDWSASDLKWDRFQEGRDYGASYTQTMITNTNSAGTLFSIPFPIDTVQNWVYATTDTNRHNYGIMVDFPEGSAGFVQQFYSGQSLKSADIEHPESSTAPRLTFVYQKIDRDNGNITVDTIFIAPVIKTLDDGNNYTGGIHGYIYRDRSPQPSNVLTLGNGVVYHPMMRFDVGKIPATATISNAILIMRTDPAGNYNYTAGDSLEVQMTRVESSPDEWVPGNIEINATDYNLLLGSGTFRDRLTDNLNNDTIRLDITLQFQRWVVEPENNFGLQLINEDEFKGDFSRIYRTRIYYNSSDRENSPKIVIYYTLPPKL